MNQMKRMPEEVMTDTSEYNQNDTSLPSCNSSRKSNAGKNSASGKMLRTDNYSDEESDLNSDDGGSFGPESEDGVNSKCDDSDELEHSKIAPLFKGLSISREKSKFENSEEVKLESSGRGDREWSSKPSSQTYHESTSDEDETSEDESSSDEENINPLEEILRNFAIPQDKNDHKTNIEDLTNDTPKDDNSKRNGSCASYISNASENEKHDTASGDNTQDEESFIKRSPDRKPKLPQHGHTPYTLNSSKREYAIANIIETCPDSDSVAKLCFTRYPELFHHCMDDLSKKAWSSTNHTPSILIDGIDESQIQLTETYAAAHMRSTDVSPILSPEPWSSPFTPSTTSNYLSPNPSPKIGTDWPVQQSISSGSPLQNSENSLLSYNSEISEADQGKVIAELTGDNHVSSFTDVFNIDYVFSNLENSNYETEKTLDEFPFISDIIGAEANQSNVSTVIPNPVVNIPEIPENINVDRVSGCPKQQTQSEFHQSPTQMDYPNPLLCSVIPIQKLSIAFQPTTDPTQFNSPTTQIQDHMTSVTNFGLTSMGHMTINSSNEGRGNITAFEKHDLNFQAKITKRNNSNRLNERDIPSNLKKEWPVSNVQRQLPSTNADSVLIPKSVKDIPKKHSPCKKNLKRGNLWMLLRLPSIPAVERLKQIISEKELQQAMLDRYAYSAEQLAEQNELGDTCLMTIVRNPTYLSSNLAHFAPLLSKMKKIPKFLTQTNKLGHDALYLAAVNCPKFDYVAGILAAVIAETCDDNNSNYWRRTYGEKRDTLMHVLAAKGDNHEAVLLELLAVQSALKRTLFDLSAKNIDGKTPFHVAVEAHNPSETGISTVKIVQRLIEHGASPTISKDLNGNTALHMATLTTCREGIIEEQLLYNAEGQKAANIYNNSHNQPVYLASACLNTTE